MTKNTIIANAFSLQMLKNANVTIRVSEIGEEEFNRIKTNAVSAIGHADTANVVGLPMNRINVALDKGDRLVVVQLMGGRLPEGSTTLPEGFSFKYFNIMIE